MRPSLKIWVNSVSVSRHPVKERKEKQEHFGSGELHESFPKLEINKRYLTVCLLVGPRGLYPDWPNPPQPSCQIGLISLIRTPAHFFTEGRDVGVRRHRSDASTRQVT